MPTYEYECQKCGHLFERFQNMSDERIKTCPECRGKVKRLLGAGAGIIFKGSGFYETDYRSDGYKSDSKKDSASTSDAKPAKKSTPAKKPSKPKKDK
ncbi:MAG: zinc ribbon domain-containing protein [Kiritimatiellae bacterium]|nr:zinc ribbon domain-containing protein [Kiritimatiellia bacterium]